MPPLTPKEIDKIPERISYLTNELESKIIADICRRIVKAGKITDTAKWQIYRLKEMGISEKFIQKEIRDYLTTVESEIYSAIGYVVEKENNYYSPLYEATGDDYIPVENNKYTQTMIEAIRRQTMDTYVNITQSMGFKVRTYNGGYAFKTVAKSYQYALDMAQYQISNGVFDYNTAIRNAIKSIAGEGIRTVDYESGYTNHIEVAARRAIMTGVSQIAGHISEQNAESLGTDIVEVTAHAGARPEHAVWQGKWYSLSGKSEKYPSLVAVTGYGTGAGLKGWNCSHDFFPVIDGVSSPTYTDEQLKNIDPPPKEYNGKKYTLYEALQKQRRMETTMRKTKRELIAADNAGDKDLFTQKSVLLQRQRSEYKKFSEAMGIRMQNERPYTYGFNQSMASKASWSARKAYQAKENKSEMT